MAKLDMDTFADIMDKYIEDNPIQMLIEMPEGTHEATIRDNTNLGPTVQYYILTQAMKQVFKELMNVVPMEDNGEKFLETVFDMLKNELMENEDNADGQETLSEELEKDSITSEE